MIIMTTIIMMIAIRLLLLQLLLMITILIIVIRMNTTININIITQLVMMILGPGPPERLAEQGPLEGLDGASRQKLGRGPRRQRTRA